MKIVGIAILLVLSLVAGLWIYRARQAPPQELQPLSETLDSAPARAADSTRPRSVVVPDESAGMPRQLEQVLARLESLEGSVREARMELLLLAQERSRISVPAHPTDGTSRLGDQDFENLRALIREELRNEAWISRQREQALVAVHLAQQLSLETKTIDPLVDVLCANGRRLFDLERELAVRNHERGFAGRRAIDFRDARRKLREDIGAIYRDGELSARIFLHVASHGEVAALALRRDNLLALEKEWLR